MLKCFERIKESLLVNFVSHFFIMFLGIGVIIFNFNKATNYSYCLIAIFYSIALIYLVSYFCYRKERDYEKLFLALLHAFISAYIFFLGNVGNSFIVLGTAILFYTFGLVLIKSVNIIVLKREKNRMFAIKAISTFFVAVVGSVCSFVLSSLYIYQCLIFGFLFLFLGIVGLFEPLLLVLLDEDEIIQKSKK